MTRGHPPLTRAVGVAAVCLVAAAAFLLLDRSAAGATGMTVLGSLVVVLLTAGLVFGVAYGQVRAERRDAARFRTLVEESPLGVCVARDGRFLYVNPATAALFGYAREEMTSGLRLESCVEETERAALLADLESRQGGEGHAPRRRFTGLRRDGELVRLDVHWRSLSWEGEPAVLGVLHDVTQLELLQEQSLRSQRLEVMGRLTGAIAHDFNNLLTAIMNGVSLALASLRSGDPARPELEDVQHTAARAADITRQLLTFSRARPSSPALLEPNEEVERMRSILRRLCGQRVRIEVSLEEGLPHVALDPTHFEQVLLNLVVNARDAIEGPGTVTIRSYHVEAGHETLRRREGPPEGPFVVLEVGDTGRGIEDNDRLRVFEPFYTTKEGGTGLGLSTVYGIVTAASGFVRVHSRVGEGSTFRVYLPTASGTAVGRREQRAQPEPQALAGPERRVILLVDDEEVVRRVTAQVLRRLNYGLLEADNGEEGARLARERAGEIDLLLTDVVLRDGSGFDVAEVFRRHNPGRPVLYTSGYADEHVSARISREGAAFLDKPYDVQRLARTVQDALKRAGSRRGSGRRAAE